MKRYQKRTAMQKTVNLGEKIYQETYYQQPSQITEKEYFSFMNTKNKILVEATSSQEEAMTIQDHMQYNTSSPGYSGSVVFD